MKEHQQSGNNDEGQSGPRVAFTNSRRKKKKVSAPHPRVKVGGSRRGRGPEAAQMISTGAIRRPTENKQLRRNVLAPNAQIMDVVKTLLLEIDANSLEAIIWCRA